MSGLELVTPINTTPPKSINDAENNFFENIMKGSLQALDKSKLLL